jgi:hypothetical protein
MMKRGSVGMFCWGSSVQSSSEHPMTQIHLVDHSSCGDARAAEKGGSLPNAYNWYKPPAHDCPITEDRHLPRILIKDAILLRFVQVQQGTPTAKANQQQNGAHFHRRCRITCPKLREKEAKLLE